jgi:hypothetical protein
MRQLILVGALAAAGLTIAGCGGLFLLAALIFSASDNSGYSGGYDPAFDPSRVYPIDNFEPAQNIPAGQWPGGGQQPNDGQWSGHLSHGTVDPTGQGNHVISLEGEVLNLP